MISYLTKIISAAAIPLMVAIIIFHGAYKKINVYDCFTEGAKDGIESTFSIIPPLVGLMVAISALRASGAFDILAKLLAPALNLIHMPPEVLPLALLRPVSGSGSMAVVSDIFKNYGCDSFIGRCASVMMGSTETTFYTLAVYFGAVGIKNSRYTAKAALTADFCGMVLSCLVTRLLFGA